MKKLVIFDLDDTLAESKQPLTHEMALYLSKLLAVTKAAVISGGALPQFVKQIVEQLPRDTNLANLYLLPTSGAALYEFNNGELKKIYEELLSEKEAQHIETVMREAAAETGTIDFSQPAYGERIEHRGAQVTLSALGQQAPVAEKKAWDPDRTKRTALWKAIAPRLPNLTVKYGGSTSIDVTKLGIDKAYGVHKLCEWIHIPEPEALYIGDQLREGGNDEAVFKTEVATCAVTNPADTLRAIKAILSAA